MLDGSHANRHCRIASRARRTIGGTLTAVLALGVSPAAASAQELGTTDRSEIVVDSWGVPHIYAEDFADLGYGYGWAQMENHGDEILRLYGLARGRAAEYWGTDFFEADRLMRTVGVPAAGEAALSEQPPELQSYLTAFAGGMNAYAEAHPEALSEEMRRVLPITPADPLRHTMRVFFTFGTAQGSLDPVVGIDGLPVAARPGSNTWAIGPSRSESGNAMLLQNPHLPWHVPLMRFFEAHLIGPETNLYGATLIGMPAVVIGFNDILGWSHTVNTIDVVDTYRLHLSGDGYFFDGETVPFDTEEVAILVRQPDGTLADETVVLRRSVLGPVVTMDGQSAIALRTPLLDRHGAVGQFWEMGRAESFEEFEAALQRLQLPMFTVSYADRDGHIFYLFNGQVPDRPFGDYFHWLGPVSGLSAETLWTGIHDYGDLPRVLDPESGFVQNSNSPPWYATVPSALEPDDFPAYMAPQFLLPREQRGLELLLSDESISFDELTRMRYSNRVLLADRLLDDLLPLAQQSDNAQVQEAAMVLAAWDRTTNPESVGAVLFQLWADQLCASAPGEIVSPANPCNFETAWTPSAPLSTPDGLANPAAAVSLLGEAATMAAAQFGSLEVAWGEVMRLNAELPGNGAAGDPLGVFHVLSYAPLPDLGFRAVHGDTWVAAIEFTPDGPRAEGVLAYGNASDADFPYGSGQLQLPGGSGDAAALAKA